MKSYQETKDAVKEAMAQFPNMFGLAGFPGEVFRISVAHSYFNDSNVLMLYTEIKQKGVWNSFAKGTVSELRRAVVQLKMSVKEHQDIHVACVNVQHNAVNCLHSDLPIAKWCDPCRAAWSPAVATDADNYDLGGPDRDRMFPKGSK